MLIDGLTTCGTTGTVVMRLTVVFAAGQCVEKPRAAATATTNNHLTSPLSVLEVMRFILSTP